ncbi:MAG: hypothetical protein HY903_03500 [Deltaproteobacteria bacterium]|nr:hypothetical protein [Deltaproteobacteria bacterium]
MGASSSAEWSNIWAVHSERSKRPAFRGWAKSEDDAKSKLEAIRKGDATPDDAYWVARLTKPQLEMFKHSGAIPKDA